MKTFFEKLEYRFLAESTTIETARFPFKADLSKGNIKTNTMASTKDLSQRTEMKIFSILVKILKIRY